MEARKTRDLLQYFVVADKREIYRFLLAPGTGFYEHIEIYFTHLAEVLWLIAHLSCCILWDWFDLEIWNFYWRCPNDFSCRRSHGALYLANYGTCWVSQMLTGTESPLADSMQRASFSGLALGANTWVWFFNKRISAENCLACLYDS